MFRFPVDAVATDPGLSGRLTDPISGPRRILHVDMDAFFAAVEQRDTPALRGKPVIVGGPPGNRGVVSTCSYEARPFGIHSGMPLREALRRCPHAIFLRTNGRKYTYNSIQVIEILAGFSPRVEPVSIDEAFLDITGVTGLFGGEEALARTLKQRIRASLYLTCSVGIAGNRVFAKLATNLTKPDGLTMLHESDIPRRVHPLPVGRLYGVGKRTVEALAGMGITTIGQLAGTPLAVLRGRFGVAGEVLSRIARGEGDDEVRLLGEDESEKSIGHEHTLHRDTQNPAVLEGLLLALAERVGRRLRHRHCAGKIIVLKLRYRDFTTLTRRQTLAQYVWDDAAIYQAALALFHTVYEKSRKVRLLGITVAGLVRYGPGAGQTDLFGGEEPMERLYQSLDRLTEHFGEGVITRGATLVEDGVG